MILYYKDKTECMVENKWRNWGDSKNGKNMYLFRQIISLLSMFLFTWRSKVKALNIIHLVMIVRYIKGQRKFKMMYALYIDY